MTNWIISDNHFNHQNIIEFENRPFNSTQEMDEYMIDQWNAVVDKNDTVYHLGDFSMGLSVEDMRCLVSMLNGHIILIRGNHDRYGTAKLLKAGFKEVINKRLIIGQYILTHRPILEDSEYAELINIHGHIHSRNKENSDKFINVSVEQVGYEPIRLDSIISNS